MTRKGHCQLENVESNLGVSHVFLSITPPHGILAKQAQGGPGASPEPQRQGRALSALGVSPHQDHSLPKPCPSRPVSPRGPGSVVPGALGLTVRGV